MDETSDLEKITILQVNDENDSLSDNIEEILQKDEFNDNEPLFGKRFSKTHSRRATEVINNITETMKNVTEECKIMVGNQINQVNKFLCFVIKLSSKLVSYHELPDWLKDNDYIHHNHRPQLESFKNCFKSVFSLHSETGNIWTHMLGVIIMILVGFGISIRPVFMDKSKPYYPKGWVEHILFVEYYISAIVCMTFSWIFHTVGCHSEHVKNIFAKFDYAGISILITGSTIPILYFGFYCYKNLFYIYMSLVIFFGILAIIACLLDIMATPRLRPIRTGIFLIFGISGVIPIIHLGIAKGWTYLVENVAVYWLLIMGLLYISGALLYAFRFPERLFPGKLNLFFQSHQIFHVCVVLASLIHLIGLCWTISYRAQLGRDKC